MADVNEHNLLDTVDPDNNNFMDNFSNFGSYTLNSFQSTGINSSDSLNIFHHNSRSILTDGRLDEYDTTFNVINNPFHILAFTETWLKPENAHIVEFTGYEPFHRLRKDDNINPLKNTVSYMIPEMSWANELWISC